MARGVWWDEASRVVGRSLLVTVNAGQWWRVGTRRLCFWMMLRKSWREAGSSHALIRTLWLASLNLKRGVLVSKWVLGIPRCMADGMREGPEARGLHGLPPAMCLAAVRSILFLSLGLRWEITSLEAYDRVTAGGSTPPLALSGSSTRQGPAGLLFAALGG